LFFEPSTRYEPFTVICFRIMVSSGGLRGQ